MPVTGMDAVGISLTPTLSQRERGSLQKARLV
jgi:hypothetical protein